MRIQSNKLFRETPVEQEFFSGELQEYVSSGTISFTIEKCMETRVCVCKNCGTELYGYWHYLQYRSCSFNGNKIPSEINKKVDCAIDKLEKQVDAAHSDMRAKFNCPICGEQNKFDSAVGKNLDEKFASAYETMRIIATRDGACEAEKSSSLYDLPVAPVNFRNISVIKNNPEKLKEYIHKLIKLETNIMLLTKRLASLYCERSIAMVDVCRVNYEPIVKAKMQNEKTQKQYDEAVKAHHRCMEQVKSYKSNQPKPVDIPMPPKPDDPIYLKPGLFNKKKILAQNEAIEIQYKLDLQEYEKKCQQRLIEIDRQNEVAKKKYINDIQEAEKAEQRAKQQVDQLYNILGNYTAGAPLEVCPEKAKLNIIAKEIETVQELLKKTYETRNKLYAADIIFTKYRDIVVLSTFYEYLMARRCTTLEGATGAYNLYESEIRANTIITKLSQIEKTLKKIEQSQYMICGQLSEMNSTLNKMNSTMSAAYSAITDIRANSKDMSEYMKHIAKNSNVIAHNTAVTAYYSKINAELTDSLGFMMALK